MCCCGRRLWRGNCKQKDIFYPGIPGVAVDCFDVGFLDGWIRFDNFLNLLNLPGLMLLQQFFNQYPIYLHPVQIAAINHYPAKVAVGQGNEGFSSDVG